MGGKIDTIRKQPVAIRIRLDQLVEKSTDHQGNANASNVFDSLKEFEEIFHALVLNLLSEALEPGKSGTVEAEGALGLVSSLQDSGVIFWGPYESHTAVVAKMLEVFQNVDGYRY
jgi:hypothetical protein